jgi:hypothetical protein
MGPDPGTAELDQFIERYVGSVEQLEILCLLCGHPEKAWSVQEVFRAIQSSESSVAARLDKFVADGILALDSQGLYRYGPQKPEISRIVPALAKAYQQRRVAIVEMIYQRPKERLHHFANAFKLRKDH